MLFLTKRLAGLSGKYFMAQQQDIGRGNLTWLIGWLKFLLKDKKLASFPTVNPPMPFRGDDGRTEGCQSVLP